MFSDEDLERLRSFPEINREELIRFFTLTPADVEFIDPGRGRGPSDRLGLAVQLCTLPWLGFVPDEVTSAPAVAVARLSERLQIPMDELRLYGERHQTRTDHLRSVARYLGWRQSSALELEELDEFLLARGLEHDSPTLLFRLACEHLISARVIRPGVVKVLERVATAREAASGETFDRVVHLLTAQRQVELDKLLVVDNTVGSTRLAWLGKGPTEASAAAVKAEVGKLLYLRGLDAHTLDLSVLPAERRRFLAAVGRRLTAQALARREPQRRYPILLTLLSQSAADVLDEVIQLFDQAISSRESRARFKMIDELAERAKSGEDRQALLDDMLTIVTDAAIPDEEIGALIRGERIGWERLEAALATAAPRLPRDHGHLAMLEGAYLYLRQFTPDVLRALDFTGGNNAQPLIAALSILRQLNATGARKVPKGAPTEFVPARWRGYLEQAARTGNAVEYRHYWELTVLLALRDGLRSGDVFVPGSRRSSDPAAYLLKPQAWENLRLEFCQLVGKSADAGAELDKADIELRTALTDLERVLAVGVGPVRLGEDGGLIIPPLSAEDIPAEAEVLKAELTELLPFAPIVSLLIELDRRTGFLECFTHAGGKQARTPELKRNLLAVLIANATNLGLIRMAEACGISYDVLAWTAEWYVREETLRAANLAIVSYHQRLPLTQIFAGLIAEHWDDLLRLAGSLKFGHATASLIVGKLSRSDRQQNAFAAALKEWGALRRTIYAAHYLADETYRRKIARQLNKGESLHALRRDLLYAHEGAIRRRRLEQQTEQAWCLTLVTNAVVTWTTEYYGLAVTEMRAQGRQVEDEILAHVSPAHSENVNFLGSIAVDIEHELAKLDPSGYRPLRERNSAAASILV